MKLYVDKSNNPNLDPAVAEAVKKDKDAGIAAKIVVRGYFPNQHAHLKDYGLDSGDLLNMYDVFLGTTNMPEKVVHYRYNPEIDKTQYHLEGTDFALARAKRDGVDYGRTMIDIDLFGEQPLGQVSMLNYLDRREENVVSDIWDWRGFRSATRYYTTYGGLTHITFYNGEGRVGAQSSFMWQHLEGKTQNEWPVVQTSFEIMDYDGEHRWFDSEQTAFDYFLSNEVKKYDAELIMS